MKRMVASIICLLIFVVASGVVYASEIEKQFMDVNWGADISDLKDFSKLGTKGNVDFYVKSNTVFTIGDITTSRVFYGFCSSKFYAVYVKIDNMEAFETILEYITKKYGEAKEKQKTKELVYNWKLNDVKIKLKQDNNGKSLKLAFYYIPLAEKVNMWPFENVVDETEKKQPEEWKLEFIEDKRKTPIGIPLLKF